MGVQDNLGVGDDGGVGLGCENSPAVIFASISTRESAGINSSGSSTRSWIGMLHFSLVLAGRKRVCMLAYP